MIEIILLSWGIIVVCIGVAWIYTGLMERDYPGTFPLNGQNFEIPTETDKEAVAHKEIKIWTDAYMRGDKDLTSLESSVESTWRRYYGTPDEDPIYWDPRLAKREIFSAKQQLENDVKTYREVYHEKIRA